MSLLNTNVFKTHSTDESISTNEYTFDHSRTFTVTQKEHTRECDDYRIDDLQSDETIFFKNSPNLCLVSSKPVTDEGVKLYSPGEVIYLVHCLNDRKEDWLYHEVADPNRVQIVNPENGKVEYTVRLRRLGLLAGIVGKQVGVWKGSNDKGRPYLHVRGDLMNMNFDIFAYESMRRVTRVGTVSKDLFNMREKLRDRGRYAVQVQPDLDSSLFVLLAIIVDEVFSKLV